MSCESYLVSKCGDGTCDDDEDHWTCPEDCEPPEPGCGDGICAAGEDYATCPQDCFETGCGLIGREGCCDGEVLKWCEAGGVFMVNCEEQPACGWSVDDGYYWCGTGGEADPDGVFLKSCEDVSNPVCGDDFCSPSENIATCAEDCLDGPVIECGDGLCEGGETPENCAEDCLVESGPEPVEDVLTADLLEVSTTDVDLIATHPDVKDTRSGKKGGCSASDAAGPEAGLVVVILLLVMGVVRRRDPRFGLFIS
jgi:hypothetical protein